MQLSVLAWRVMACAGLVALAVMVGTTLLAVIARYFDVLGFEWSYEVAGIAFLWVTFLGTILAEAQGHNAAFGLLRDAAPARIRIALHYIADLVLLAVGAMLLASGIAMLRRTAFVPSPLLRLPGFIPGTAVPVLGASLCIMALRRLILRRRA